MDFFNANVDKNFDFRTELNTRVKNILGSAGKYSLAGPSSILKTVIILSIFLIPYYFIVTANMTNPGKVLLMWIIMGIGGSGIWMCVVHDAGHNSLSRFVLVNKIAGYLLNLTGGSISIWRIRHNYLHHTFTSVTGWDEYIDYHQLMRLSNKQERKWIHRFQHWYGWLLYGLQSLEWITIRDFNSLKRYRDEGLLNLNNLSYKSLRMELYITKLIFLVIFIILPVWRSMIPWWQTLLFFTLMSCIQAFIFTIVYLPAHVSLKAAFPYPGDSINSSPPKTEEILSDTVNFAPQSRIFSWFTGGLNYQVENHLFPSLSHFYYRKISRVVKKTAADFGLPYNVEENYLKALISHFRMLYKLGNED